MEFPLNRKVEIMARPDFEVTNEIQDIMERIAETFPRVFPGFDVNKIGSLFTKDKKARKPIRVISVGYPRDVWIDKTYIVEVFDEAWKEMTPKQRNLAVFHSMCFIPEGGFDAESSAYGKKRRYDYEMFAEEFAVTNGVPNWLENDDARDVFDAAEETKGDLKYPVTVDDVANA